MQKSQPLTLFTMISTINSQRIADDRPEPITQPYLLLTSLPFFVDEIGGVWLDPLWHRDFVRHFDYIKHLILAAPSKKGEVNRSSLVRVDPPNGAKFSVISLPQMESFVQTLLKLPIFMHRLWSGIGRVEIVHSGIVGWPFPLGLLANPIVLLHRKKLLLVVESAPGRQPGNISRNLANKFRGAVTEFLGRFYVNRAGIVFFTQPPYQDTLMTNGSCQSHVVAATWINGDEVLTDNKVDALWEAKKISQCNEVRYLFASRLTEQKGVRVLLDALHLLDQSGTRFAVDVIGDGVPWQECINAKSTLTNIKFNVLEPVPYGQPFFELVRRYHSLNVPTISDGQPRIIFDANSQGVSIIAFETDGTRPFVKNLETGWLVAIVGAKALADQLRSCTEAPHSFQIFGSNSVKFAARTPMNKCTSRDGD